MHLVSWLGALFLLDPCGSLGPKKAFSSQEFLKASSQGEPSMDQDDIRSFSRLKDGPRRVDIRWVTPYQAYMRMRSAFPPPSKVSTVTGMWPLGDLVSVIVFDA